MVEDSVEMACQATLLAHARVITALPLFIGSIRMRGFFDQFALFYLFLFLGWWDLGDAQGHATGYRALFSVLELATTAGAWAIL